MNRRAFLGAAAVAVLPVPMGDKYPHRTGHWVGLSGAPIVPLDGRGMAAKYPEFSWVRMTEPEWMRPGQTSGLRYPARWTLGRPTDAR